MPVSLPGAYRHYEGTGIDTVLVLIIFQAKNPPNIIAGQHSNSYQDPSCTLKPTEPNIFTTVIIFGFEYYFPPQKLDDTPTVTRLIIT